MNSFIIFRDNIRKAVLAKESLFIKIWTGLIALVGLLCISTNFGYQKTLSQTWVSIVLAFVCAFLPVRGMAAVLTIVLLVDLSSLNLQVAMVALGLVVAGYLVCAYFRSKNTYNMTTVPVCYCFHAPYAMAIGTGLMCSLSEITSVICGTVTAYFLHVIKLNATAILDESTKVNVFTLLKEQLLMSRMFYFFLAAMVAMFLVVYSLRLSAIKMSWLVATAAGVGVEFIIMLTGFLLNNAKGEIPGLIIGSIICFAVGFILNYFILDLDYSRIEKVQFEDDDYYYYVTAVPKIRLVSEEKEVKTINHKRGHVVR